MRHIELRKNFLPCQYPLKYAEPERSPDISLIITDRCNERQIPQGSYHFNFVSCTCPPDKRGLLDRIQSLFRKKSLQTQLSNFICDVHSLNHHMVLESHNSLANMKQSRKAEPSLNLLCYHYPLNYVESEKDSDLTLIIRDTSDENYIPPDIYYFKHISCSCPSEKKGLLGRIESLFKRKSPASWDLTSPCDLHSFNHDLLLQFYDHKKI